MPSPRSTSSTDSTTTLVSGRYRAPFKMASSVRWAFRPKDFFQIIHVLPRRQFLHTPSFLALTYTDDLILLEITFISGRPKGTRLGLLKALNDGVVAAAEISPDDLVIMLYETPGENISFGRGLAQRARIPGTESQAEYAHHA